MENSLESPQLIDAIRDNSEEFQLMYAAYSSACSYRFDGGNPDKPTLPSLSFRDAMKKSSEDESRWDSIGLQTKIYHKPTGVTFHHLRAPLVPGVTEERTFASCGKFPNGGSYTAVSD